MAKTWEDTVIGEREVLKLCEENPLLDFSCTDDYPQEFEAIVNKQAEITWKARELEIAEAKKGVIKKFVDWLALHRNQELAVGYHRFTFTENEWQAFLKEIESK